MADDKIFRKAVLDRLSSPEQLHLLMRVTDALGAYQCVGRPARRSLELRRYEERDEYLIEDAHHDGVITRGFGDGDGLLGEGLAPLERRVVGELAAEGGEQTCPIRSTFR